MSNWKWGGGGGTRKGFAESVTHKSTLERCSGFSQGPEESAYSRHRIQRVQAQAVWSDQGQHVRVGDDGQAGRRPAEWQGPDHKRPRRPREHTDNAASSQWTNRPLEDLQHQNGHENTFLIKRLRILIWY